MRISTRLLSVLIISLAAMPLWVQAKSRFTLTSSDIPANSKITAPFVFNSFGCTGENKSPALSWKGAPKGTQSFAITMYDPDAPTGSGWWHWVAFNIPADVAEIKAGMGRGDSRTMPGIQSRTDFGTTGYGGPCPPPGSKAHRYIFTVWALKVDKLNLDADAPAAMVGYFLNANKLAKASFTARYKR